MADKFGVNLRAKSDSQFLAWENAAKAERRELPDWIRVVLDIAAESGLNSLEIEEALNPVAKRTGKSR